jgi:hypothetical protein
MHGSELMHGHKREDGLEMERKQMSFAGLKSFSCPDPAA